MKEILNEFYHSERYTTYQIVKSVKNSDIYILLIDTSKSPFGVVSYVKFDNVDETIESPFLSWTNLFFCSNYYGPHPARDYMNNAVQNNQKTTATAYVNKQEYFELIKTLPPTCHACPYDSDLDNMSMAYVYRDGCLNDYFNFEAVKHIYELHGLKYDLTWNKIEDLFYKPLSFFANKNDCGFNLQSGGSHEINVINGLLLGYPIESTIAYILRTHKTFGPPWMYPELKDHFSISTTPYTTQNLLRQKITWYKQNDIIYCDGQQESLYY